MTWRIGCELGVTREHVCQSQIEVLLNLKQTFESHGVIHGPSSISSTAATSLPSPIRILNVLHAAGVSIVSNPIPFRASVNTNSRGGMAGRQPVPKMMSSGPSEISSAMWSSDSGKFLTFRQPVLIVSLNRMTSSVTVSPRILIVPGSMRRTVSADTLSRENFMQRLSPKKLCFSTLACFDIGASG